MKIVILDNNNDTAAWQSKLASIAEIMPVDITSGAIASIDTLSHDLVAMSPVTAKNLLLGNSHQHELTPTKRTQLSSKTHHGIQLLAIRDVIYFHADHKYVAAYHQNGMILLNDTLNALEVEFADLFLRIHRQTLVAADRIKALSKNNTGNWIITLIGREEQLIVSRRELPQVRKYLKQHAHK